MRLAMEKVSDLKKAIAARTDIPEDKQVLLISGGESLSNTQRVCSYSSAGTDTSPIFLFSIINIESNQPPLPNVDYGDDADMTEMIESCMSMQPSLDTLVARTELAADLNEQAVKQKEICERLVHDQHLQQQGWAAVTANLDDLSRAFKNKSEMLMEEFEEFAKNKDEYKELLNKFGDDIKHLDAIPVLPNLIENNKSIIPVPATKLSTSVTCSQTTSQVDEVSKKDTDAPQNEKAEGKNASPSEQTQDTAVSDESMITLRQWIDYHDSQSSLEKLIELCWIGLERFNVANDGQIRHHVQDLLKLTTNTNMKEIKGLEERLFGLEKLMVDSRKVVDEQSQLAASFQNNRERFSKIKDSTLLPDLSASHKQQLQMMLNNHKKMSDYRNRCIKAKHELSVSLHNRLKWIMIIEQQISDMDGNLIRHKENLNRLTRNFDIVNQVHRSPELYLEAVVESLRRRRFSRHYRHWANSIAEVSQELYAKEMSIRKAFDAKLGNHFLAGLFPGLTRAYPPSFATSPPEPFDTELPRITARDIEYLSTSLSGELAKLLHIPQDAPMPHITVASGHTDGGQGQANEDDRHSLNPTPPSSHQSQSDE